MNKTETLLWLMRAHEAVRKLPEDAEINGVVLSLYDKTDRIRVFMDGPVDVKNAVSRTAVKYNEIGSGREDVRDSNGVVYWWAVRFSEDGTIEGRA